jgi:4-carboxymuconolactone decarboxylase
MPDRDLQERGLVVRREVLGVDYVDRAMARHADYEQAFQSFLNEHCWGLVWTDQRLTRRERSLIVLGVTAAMGRDSELRLHLLGALNNGLTMDELAAAIIQVAVYAGIPAGVSAMRALREVLAESEGS